jgi:NAD(P)-dependent dehydrogenase (short-subunit alcohol dehydrogenase family)
MQGKVVVITGATSGLGRIAATRLAQMGARLVLVARDHARADKTLAALREAGPSQPHTTYLADLSLMADVKRVGAEIAAAEPRIDVLINNAGSLFSSRQVTTEGLERTFATNHMAYFILTQMLLPSLKAAGRARIVNTASGAHRGNRLDFDDLQSTRGYRAQTVYGRTKLCNILFTRELAKRLAGTGITANCPHPGFVATGLGQRDNGLVNAIIWIVFRFASKPEPGAETIVYLASDPDVADVSGEYFYGCELARPSTEARDTATAQRLWEESVKIAVLSKSPVE